MPKWIDDLLSSEDTQSGLKELKNTQSGLKELINSASNQQSLVNDYKGKTTISKWDEGGAFAPSSSVKGDYNALKPQDTASTIKEIQNTMQVKTAEDWRKKNATLNTLDALGNKANYEVQKDTLGGNIKSNFRSGLLGVDSNKAWQNYIKFSTPENLKYAETLDKLNENYATINQDAMQGKTTAERIIGNTAQYIPQAIDQAGYTAVGGAIGTALGNPKAGVIAAQGVYSLQNMKAAAFKELRKFVDDETALKMANDEAVISSIIEMGDTFVDLMLLGFGVNPANIGKAVTKNFGKKSALKLASALGKYGLNILQEGEEEASQQSVSQANIERAESGNDTGLLGLAKSSADRYIKSFTGQLSQEDMDEIKQARQGGRDVAVSMGIVGGLGADVVNTVQNEINNAKLGQEIRNTGNEQNIIDQAKSYGIETKDKLTDAELGATYREVQTAMKDKARQDAIQTAGLEGQEAQVMDKELQGEKLTKKETKVLEKLKTKQVETTDIETNDEFDDSKVEQVNKSVAEQVTDNATENYEEMYNEIAESIKINDNKKLVENIRKAIGNDNVVLEEFTGDDEGYIGKTENGKVIKLNSNALGDVEFRQVALHELTHTIEGTKAYENLFELTKNHFGDGYQEVRDKVAKIYNDKFGVDENRNVDAEVVADYLGDLLKDSNKLSQILNDDRNVAQKLLDSIREIIKTVGNKLHKTTLSELEQAEKLLSKGLEEKSKGQESNFEGTQHSGYFGYSMSNNAVKAYENGEKPLSKWTKQDILDGVREINPDIVSSLEKVTLPVLKDKILVNSSWHHTSEYYNKTDFYSIDEDVENLTNEDISKWEKPEKVVQETNKYRGDIDYIEWGGTRNYPKKIEHHLSNVNIEEKGQFYVVTDDNGKELVRKKIGSNGTKVLNYTEEEARKEESRKVRESYDKYLATQKIEQPNDHSLSMKYSNGDIGKALYTINKEAKHIRDISKNDISEESAKYLKSRYGIDVYNGKVAVEDFLDKGSYFTSVDEIKEAIKYVDDFVDEDRDGAIKKYESLINKLEHDKQTLNTLLKDKSSLYFSKDQVLKNLQPIEYHKFSKEENPRPYYNIGGYEFHGEQTTEDVPIAKTIEGVVSAENKLEDKMSLSEAEKVLKGVFNVDVYTNALNKDTKYSSTKIGDTESATKKATNFSLESENKKLKAKIEQLKNEKKLTNGKLADEKELRKFANSMAEGTGYKGKDIVGEITDIWNKINNKEYESAWNDIYNLGEKLAKSIEITEDIPGYQEVKDFLKGTRIKVEQKSDAVNYEDIRKRNFNLFTLANDGIPMDDFYQQLQEEFPQTFKDVNSDGEMLQEIDNYLQSNKPISYPLSDSMLADARASITNEILSQIVGIKPYQTWADKQKTLREQAVLKEKNKWETRNEKAKARKEISDTQNKLLRVAKQLHKIKTTQEYRNQIDSLLGDLNLTSLGASKQAKLEYSKLLQDYEEKMKDENFTYNEKYYQFLKSKNGTFIKDLSMEEAETLIQNIQSLYHDIITYNKLLANEHTENISDLSRKAIQEINLREGQKISKVTNQFNVYALSPRVFFKRLGSYKNGAIQSLFNELQNGSIKYLDFIQKATTPFDNFEKEHKVVWDGKNAELIPINIEGNKIYINKGMRISLAMHLQNNSNMLHIASGGIKIPDMKLYNNGDIGNAYLRGTTVQLTKENINEILKGMTAEEIQFVKLLQDYFKYSQQEINKVSRVLKGYELATVDNYFPINADKTEFVNNNELIQNGTLEGLPFLISRKEGSTNPILLESANQVLLRQLSKVAKYVGYAIPIRDLNSTLAYHKSGNTNLQGEIGRIYTDSANKYISNLTADLQVPFVPQDIMSGLFNKLRGNYAAAALNFNPAVTIGQTASYPTALAVLDAKSLTEGLKRKVSAETINKYTPLYWYRSKGYVDNELASIKDSDGKFSKVIKKMPGTKWIQFADMLTTKQLWGASEVWVENHTDLEVGTEAFYKKVAEKYNQVILETQPNYETLSKPQHLRAKDTMVKSLFMFKTQSYQNYNILFESADEYFTKLKQNASKEEIAQAKNKMINSTITILLANAVYTAMKNVARRIRRKDDDKWKDEEGRNTIFKGLFQNFFGNLSGNIPFGSQLWEIHTGFTEGSKGYQNNVFDVSWFEGLSNATASSIKFANSFYKYGESIVDGYPKQYLAQNGSDLLSNSFKLCKDVSYLTGIPLNNITAYMGGMFKTISPDLYARWVNVSNPLGKKDIDSEETFNIVMENVINGFDQDLYDLYKEIGEDIIPSKIGSTYTLDGEEKTFDIVQTYDANQIYSSQVNKLLDQVLDNKYYKNADAETKKEMIRNVYTFSKQIAIKSLDSNYELSKWVQDAQTNPSKYIVNKALGVSSSQQSKTDNVDVTKALEIKKLADTNGNESLSSEEILTYLQDSNLSNKGSYYRFLSSKSVTEKMDECNKVGVSDDTYYRFVVLRGKKTSSSFITQILNKNFSSLNNEQKRALWNSVSSTEEWIKKGKTLYK